MKRALHQLLRTVSPIPTSAVVAARVRDYTPLNRMVVINTVGQLPNSTVCFRKRRAERESESASRISQEEGIVSEETSKAKLPGLLELDQALLDHVQHAITNIKPLPSIKQQLQELAK